MASKQFVQQITFLVLLISSHIYAYPVFGTKRYARSTAIPAHRIATWTPLPIQPFPAPQLSTPNHFLAPTYFTDYPYAQDYDTEYYYPPETAYNAYPPVPAPYYSAGTNDNFPYTIYHSMLPYFYDNRRAYTYYGYDDSSDPVDDLHDELQQEEREEGGENESVGEESWFENSGSSSQQPQQQQQQPQQQEQPQQQTQESMADVNAAFLQNLILSQMYNDAQNRENAYRQQQYLMNGYFEDPTDEWVYGEPRTDEVSYYSDDEDEPVKELKSLVKKPSRKYNDRLDRTSRRREDQYWYDNSNQDKNYGYPTWEGSSGKDKEYAKVFGVQMQKKSYDQWVPENVKTINFSDRKGVPPAGGHVKIEEHSTTEGATTSASTTTSTTEAPDFDPRRGQKEVPLLRPALPPRPVFRDAMDELMRTQVHRSNNPSVYETIKKLLTMEEDLREDREQAWRSQPKKRFVSNEESLVEQLGGLKKDVA